jgi:hypothetical protein
MTLNIDSQTIYSVSNTARHADKQSRVDNIVQTGNSTVEKIEEENKWSSVFATRKELTPEEQRRVEFLKNLLVQTLTMAQGDPTEDQKKQIREIEDELEKITGVKTQTKLSNVTDKLPGKDDEDEEKEKQQQQRQAKGMDPKNAIHNNMEIKEKTASPGMQMLQRNAHFGRMAADLPAITELVGKTK